MTLHVIHYYYDIIDPGNPVRKYYEDSIVVPVNTRGYNELEVKMVKNEYVINSGLLQYSESDPK